MEHRFGSVGEVDPIIEAARTAEIERIRESARQRTVASDMGKQAVVREYIGTPVPYSGDESRTVVDVPLPDMRNPQSRANLPA